MSLHHERFTMVSHVYRLDLFHPHGPAIVFLCLVALIAIFFLVRGTLTQSRRNLNQRPNPANPTEAPPKSNSPGVCQRCRSPLSVEAAYCGRCGLPVSRPVPISMPRQRAGPGASRGLILAIIVLLGMVGLGAFMFLSHSETQSAPPVQQRAPTDSW